MKKLISIFILCSLSTISGLSQPKDLIIHVQNTYYHNGRELNSKELKAILTSEPESAIEYNKAQSRLAIGIVPFVLGTGLLAYGSIGLLKIQDASDKSIYKESMEPVVYYLFIAAGGTAFAFGLPFLISHNSSLKKSIKIYNSNHLPNSFNNKMKLDIGISQNGVGLFYVF